MLGLFALFFLPLLVAMWMYFGPNTWLTSKTRNHGDLIQPPRPLDEFNLKSFDESVWTQKTFMGKWTLLYLGDTHCDLYCEASLFKMRQVQKSLGRDSQRVQRKYLGLGRFTNKGDIQEIFMRYPDMQIKWFDQTEFSLHLPQFKDLNEHAIYVIDPHGNLMMHYSENATSKGIKKDLKRLLKVSRIG